MLVGIWRCLGVVRLSVVVGWGIYVKCALRVVWFCVVQRFRDILECVLGYLGPLVLELLWKTFGGDW